MATDFNKKLGARISQFRERIGLSQQELAARLAVGRVTVSQIENGQRKITGQEAATLCKIFNINSDILLDLKRDIEVTLQKKANRGPRSGSTIRISVPQKNLAKFKEVLLYVLKQVGSKPNLGEVVLYKLLYFIDFDYYEKYEEQLIGATYIKNHHGPTPKEFAKIVGEMEGKDLTKVQTKYFQYPQKKYLPLREPDLSILSAREKAVIDSVLDRLSDKNATEISAYSHDDVPWLTTEDGEVMDYESVFYRTPAYSVRTYDEQDIQ